MRRMMFVERAARAWAGRAASENWAEWAIKHEGDNKLLMWLEKVANDRNG